MIKNNYSKFIGSVLIVIGTSMGAGMLALPLVSAPVGIMISSIALISIWGLMVITGLLVLEVNLAMDNKFCSFSSMADKTLGYPGKITAWISCLFLLYALTAAYITGASSLLTEYIKFCFNYQIPDIVSVILFVLVFGTPVFWSTKATDLLNRGLISIKGILLFFTIASLAPHVDFVKIMIDSSMKINWYVGALFPMFITAFGYHTVIPSIRIYCGDNPKMLKNIIILGTVIALIIYLLWMAIISYIVPSTGINSFEQIGGSVNKLINSIILIINNKWISIGINGFANIAMTTSFLGVTLGLFDFIADGFNRPNTRFGRLQTSCLTFMPPIIFALYYPQGFIIALNYASIFIAILEIILPVFMVYKLRYSPFITNDIKKNVYQTFGGKYLLLFVFITGVVLIILQILINLHLIPVII